MAPTAVVRVGPSSSNISVCPAASCASERFAVVSLLGQHGRNSVKKIVGQMQIAQLGLLIGTEKIAAKSVLR